MKLKSIKTEEELFEAVAQPVGERKPVEVTSINGQIKAVRIGAVHITGGYDFAVNREVEFEEVNRYRVIASIEGMPAQVSYFEDYSEMREKARSYNINIEVDTNNDKHVQVHINDAGEVVRDDTLGAPAGAAPVPTTLDDDIPF